MNFGKRILNGLGTILAFLLSIVLVVLLFVAPTLLSAISVITPDNLRQTMEEIQLPELIFAVVGDSLDVDEKQLMDIASTNAVQEIYNSYLSGIFDVIEGKTPQETLTETKIQDILLADFDQIFGIFKDSSPELIDVPEEQAKEMFTGMMQQVAVQLPTPESLVQDLFAQQPEMDTVLEVWTQIGKVKPAFIGAVVVLSLLIFVCRLFGFRGFRWLSVDLFIATGLSGIACLPLALSEQVMEVAMGENEALALISENLMSNLTQGVYIRTGILLLAAIALMVTYCIVRKKLRQKQECQQYTQTVAQEFTQDYTQAYTQDYTQDYTQAYTQDYTQDYTQNYTQDYTQDYTQGYTQVLTQETAQENVQEVAQETTYLQ